jgi:NADPH:quinone reductase-like Zn-dependent oxidoreductase
VVAPSGTSPALLARYEWYVLRTERNSGSTMRAAFITGYRPRGKCVVGELPKPALRTGEVLVRVHAAALNPVDVKLWKGMLRPAYALNFPQVLGLELSGVVEESSSGSRFRPGDEVFGVWPRRPHALAQWAAVPERALAAKPKTLDHFQAAALPLVSLTAWQALFEIVNVRAGEKVFIQAGAGGFGSIAIQVAKSGGAEVTTTVSGPYVNKVREFGADRVVDYQASRFEEVVQQQDVAIECIDGLLQRTVHVLKPGGTLVSVVGPPDAYMLRAMGMPRALSAIAGGLLSLRARRYARRRGIRCRSMFAHEDGTRLEALAQLVANGKLRPVVDRVAPLADVPCALEYADRGVNVDAAPFPTCDRRALRGVGGPPRVSDRAQSSSRNTTTSSPSNAPPSIRTRLWSSGHGSCQWRPSMTIG